MAGMRFCLLSMLTEHACMLAEGLIVVHVQCAVSVAVTDAR